jgi:putative peptidoglycan lipid II flippase
LVLFELVSRFYSAAQRVLSQGLIAPLLPQMTRLANRGEWAEFAVRYRRQVVLVLAASLLIIAGIEAIALNAIRLMSASSIAVAGRLSADDLGALAVLAAYMAGLLPCMALSNVLNNAYYAQGDTRSPTVIAVAAYTVGVIVKLVGFWVAGVQGLALAATVWSVIYCGWLYSALGQRTARLMQRPAAVGVM